MLRTILFMLFYYHWIISINFILQNVRLWLFRKFEWSDFHKDVRSADVSGHQRMLCSIQDSCTFDTILNTLWVLYISIGICLARPVS